MADNNTDTFDADYKDFLAKEKLEDSPKLKQAARDYFDSHNSLEGFLPEPDEEQTAEEQNAQFDEEASPHESDYKEQVNAIFDDNANKAGVNFRTVEDEHNPTFLVKEFLNANGEKNGSCTFLGNPQNIYVGSETFKHYQVMAQTAKDLGFKSLNCEKFMDAPDTMKIMLLAAYVEAGLAVKNFDQSINYLNSDIVKALSPETQDKIGQNVFAKTWEVRKKLATTKLPGQAENLSLEERHKQIEDSGYSPERIEELKRRETIRFDTEDEKDDARIQGLKNRLSNPNISEVEQPLLNRDGTPKKDKNGNEIKTTQKKIAEYALRNLQSPRS